jgi:N-acetylglutamate synthase-like GNAT family acetyltransferase
MSIRKADLEDATEVLSVINKSNAEAYRKMISPQYFKEPLFTYEDILKKFEEMNFYVYELEGKVVGVAALEPKGNVANVRLVYVLPQHQRKGVGTSLVKHIEVKAKGLSFADVIRCYSRDHRGGREGMNACFTHHALLFLFLIFAVASLFV